MFERAVKYIRRHAVVSSLATIVVLTLLTGVVVSSYFAYTANREASEARTAEKTADENAKTARKAEKKAEARAKAESEAKTFFRQQKVRADDEAKKAKVTKKRAETQLARAQRLVYSSKLLLTQNALVEGNGSLAMQSLDQCPWNLRG